MPPFPDGIPQAVDPFPFFVVIVLAAAAIWKWLRDRSSPKSPL
jgi:hypothetical protein